MDPQQRLLLHFSWDALSGSGMLLTSLAALGVYVGISGSEYGRLSMTHASALSAFLATGSAVSVAAGRLSFTYGAQVGIDIFPLLNFAIYLLGLPLGARYGTWLEG